VTFACDSGVRTMTSHLWYNVWLVVGGVWGVWLRVPVTLLSYLQACREQQDQLNSRGRIFTMQVESLEFRALGLWRAGTPSTHPTGVGCRV